MKHKCHVCNKDYDCEKDCKGPDDYPCEECVAHMGVEEQAIQCLPPKAREAIVKTIREVQFRLSAVWKDGFTYHQVKFETAPPDFSIVVSLAKEGIM